MPSLRLTVLKCKVLANGKHKIRVAVSHHHKTSYIATKYTIDNLSQFKDGAIVKHPDATRLNVELRNLLNKYQAAIDSIRGVGRYSCNQLRDILSERVLIDDSRSFQDVAQEYIQNMSIGKRQKYASLIEWSIKVLNNYTKSEILLDDISSSFLSRFCAALSFTSLSSSSISTVLSHIKVIVNYAIAMGYVHYTIHPFTSIKVQKSQARDCAISLDKIKLIRDSEPKTKREQIAKDLFLLSLYMGGMNLIDLMSSDLQGQHVSFVRSKTMTRSRYKTILPITAQARLIIDKWLSKDKLDFGYKLSYSNFSNFVNKSLQKLAQELGIGQITFSSARHSFAQVALQLGISDVVVDYCLGHSNFNRGVIAYYSHVNERQAADAVKRVVDYISSY